MATRSTYRARVLVQIVGHRAVERVGELLAFHSSLGGGWQADGARFEFDASGPVGRMSESSASGSFAIADLSLHPAGAGAPIAVRRVAGQFRRSPAEIQLASLSVDAGGVAGTGS